jgi:cytochrome P450
MTNIPQLESGFLIDLLHDHLPATYASYADLRAMGSVVRDAHGVLLACRYHSVAQIIKDPAFAFDVRQVYGALPDARAGLAATGYFDLLAFRNGGSHRQGRRSLAQLMTPTRMQSIRSLMTQAATDHLRRANQAPTFDCVSNIARPLSFLLFAQLLGQPNGSLRMVLDNSVNVSSMLAAAPVDDANIRAGTIEFERLTAWIDDALGNHGCPDAKLEPVDLAAGLSNAERRTLILDLAAFLLTGHDALCAMLGNATAALLSDPDAARQLIEDPAIVARAADELIRFDSAGQVAFRHATRDVEIEGHLIREGEMVAALIGSANHDERVFAVPDRLYFGRAGERPMSFGAGPHSCIGAVVAKTMLIAFLEALIPYLPNFKTAGEMPRAHQHGIIRGRHKLMLTMASPEAVAAPPRHVPDAARNRNALIDDPDGHDKTWLLEQAGHVEREAFAAIDRFSAAPVQAELLRTIVSNMLQHGGQAGGVCHIAQHIPLLVYSGIKGNSSTEIYKLAAALTLLDAGIYTLDHIMDRELEGPLLSLPSGSVLLGAVCLISHLPYQLLLSFPSDSAQGETLVRMLADGLSRIGAGQLIDISSHHRRVCPSSYMITEAVQWKTGERRALFARMAAVLAGGSPEQQECYADFGRALGVARQLRSDLFDLFGAQPSRDLASGTATLPLALYLESCEEDLRADMERLLAERGGAASQRQICDRLRDSGILREVIGRIEEQCRLAIDRLERARPANQVTPLLRQLALSGSIMADAT